MTDTGRVEGGNDIVLDILGDNGNGGSLHADDLPVYARERRQSRFSELCHSGTCSVTEAKGTSMGSAPADSSVSPIAVGDGAVTWRHIRRRGSQR
jgi:hypothetical protein